MATPLLEQIIALTEDLSEAERSALLAYLQQLDEGRVFLCQSERNIFLGSILSERNDA